MSVTNSSKSVARAIKQLYQLAWTDIRAGWRYYTEDSQIKVGYTKDIFCQDQKNLTWSPVQLNEKGYIVFPAGETTIWLRQELNIPETLQGYPLAGLNLRLILTWWAKDARVYLNGKLIESGDLFDSAARVLLTPKVIPGETITVIIRLVSPGHDIGALMKSACLYCREDGIDPSFVADEISVLKRYLTAFAPDKIAILATELEKIEWEAVADREKFNRSLNNLRDRLIPLTRVVKQSSINLLAHAHLDLAWLWTVAEALDVADRTFKSVLNLQQDYPYLTFCHTTPALYEWIEKNRPDLFTQIQKAVKNKTWEVLGGMWVEPEINLLSGESLVRQLLYGQKYIKEKFGKITTIAWLPDSFGFCASLPQILAQSGIEYFVTGKLHWNDTTKFPHGFFKWRSPDGSEVLTLMSPPNLTGVMDTNPITMANYAVDWQLQTGIKDAFWLPGVGDRGGGPSRDMLEVYRRCAKSPFFPNLKFTRAIDYLEAIATKQDIPVWQEELYLELHRGCYTTHGEQKYFNRRCEGLLYQAELWASLASITGSGNNYPDTGIETAWKKVLLNQFHDILPGTSIPEVFVEANRDWIAAENIAKQILWESIDAIASQIILPTPPQSDAIPIFVFNSLNWIVSQVVCLDLSDRNCNIYTLAGEKLSTQVSHDNKLLFLAEDVPSVGYRVFWLSSDNLWQRRRGAEEVILDRSWASKSLFDRKISSSVGFENRFILENEWLKVTIDPQTGNLRSIFDKVSDREILNGAGNQLQSFQDKGQYWDAWNIDPDYNKYPLSPSGLVSIDYLEFGPIRFKVRVVRQLGQSSFIQDYILEVNSPLLKIATTANWQETHVLVKATFPLNFQGDRVTHEIPYGAISRPTTPETPPQQAKWEICTRHWLDFSARRVKEDNCQDYGVSFLNDSKYGCDFARDRLRISLLRGSVWPDPSADRGEHKFTYAVYPHSGDWRKANTVRRGYELNIPLVVKIGLKEGQNNKIGEQLRASESLFDLGADNLILSAFKKAEDRGNTWIVRCYECHGQTAELALNSNWEIVGDRTLDLLERSLQPNLVTNPRKLIIRPWKIVTFAIARRESEEGVTG